MTNDVLFASNTQDFVSSSFFNGQSYILSSNHQRAPISPWYHPCLPFVHTRYATEHLHTTDIPRACTLVLHIRKISTQPPHITTSMRTPSISQYKTYTRCIQHTFQSSNTPHTNGLLVHPTSTPYISTYKNISHNISFQQGLLE